MLKRFTLFLFPVLLAIPTLYAAETAAKASKANYDLAARWMPASISTSRS